MNRRRVDCTKPSPIVGRRCACWTAAVVIVAAACGCEPAFRPPRRVDFFRARPVAFEQGPELNVPPQRGVPLPPMPPVIDPAAALTAAGEANTPWPLSLEEAIQIGLSNSGIVRVLDGGGVSAASATPYDPEIAEARARMLLAAFDPQFTSTIFANWIDQPPEAVFGPGLSEPTRRDEAGYNAALTKPWVAGTETKVAYNPSLGYLFIPAYDGSSFNPLYTSNIEFSVRQPLLRGAGVRFNKAPLRIAQLRRDQTALDTRQAVMASLRSVTEAYWDLYSVRAAAAAIEEVTPLLERVVHVEQERLAAQRSVRADVAKVESQFRAVRQQLVAARSSVVQSELRLRNLLGLPPSDGMMIVPTSTPLAAPVTIDPQSAADIALQNRPDLIRQRLAVRTREHELLIARNAGLPQLDATGLYRWNGVGDHLDDSLNQMFGTKYHDWQTSLTLSVPLGRRAAAANIRAATLTLCREKAALQQATHASIHSINALAQQADYAYQLYTEADARLRANAEWLAGAKIRYENPPPAGDGQDWLLAALNDYLLALRSQADAASDAQTFLARYNALLARLNEAMGTILSDCDVQLAEAAASAT